MAQVMAAHAFLSEWRLVTGRDPDEATVILVLDPGQWLRERKGSDDD